MILRRFSDAIRKQEWFTVAIELFIVVLGVFLGLQANNWNEERSDAVREMQYLLALQEDFRLIIGEIESDMARFEEIALNMNLLLDQSRKATPDITLEELNKAAGMLIAMEGTPIASNTYDNLTGSGDLAIIKSQAVKNALSSFFGRADIVRLVSTTHEMQLVNIFQPYIIEHFDYTTAFPGNRGMPMISGLEPERTWEVLPSSEFRNVVAVKWDIASDLRNLLRLALVEAYQVEELLAKELQDR